MTDRHQVLQILVNLIANAKDAMITKPASIHRLSLRVSMAGNGTHAVRLEVADTGCGISAEHLPRLFTQGVYDKTAWTRVGPAQCRHFRKEYGRIHPSLQPGCRVWSHVHTFSPGGFGRAGGLKTRGPVPLCPSGASASQAECPERPNSGCASTGSPPLVFARRHNAYSSSSDYLTAWRIRRSPHQTACMWMCVLQVSSAYEDHRFHLRSRRKQST